MEKKKIVLIVFLIVLLVPIIFYLILTVLVSSNSKIDVDHPLIGPKKVIVHFNIDWTPEGDLGEEEAEIQRQRILDTQNDFLNKVPEYSVDAKFKYTPSIAISVDSIFLPYIASFSYVDSIRQDRPAGYN